MEKRQAFGSDQPPALLHLFEPPDGYIGSFGWLCGYSADAFFMNAAAELFTRRTQRRRAAEGEIVLGLVLDAGSPRVSLVDAPGVLHLPLPPTGAFRLMHAKVALLGYRALASDAWRLRLLVSTGNWTRETLEESLDLAWRIEVGSGEIGSGSANVGQRLTDIAAAADFLAALRDRVNAAPLKAGSRLTQEAVAALDRCSRQVAESAAARGRPRFVDNRRQALLPQIVERIAPGRRNYLAMGSGFYEGGSGGAVPRVPARIVEALRAADILAPQAEVALFANPHGCQAVAGSMPAIAAAGWDVFRPGNGPFRHPRTLHAKFLFGAQADGRSQRCLRAWLYLGSGNLTHPGLLREGPAGGNLEAGVVLAPEGLDWEENGVGVSVKSVLPICWDSADLLNDGEVEPGGEMPEGEEAFRVAPVSHLVWTPAPDGTGRLRPPAEANAVFDVLSASGELCAREGRSLVWQGACPPEATIAWEEDGQRCAERVPVIDDHGRIGATPLSPLGFDEAWSLLAEFPDPPVDDGGGTDPDEDDDDLKPGDASRHGTAPTSDYPIRRIMGLIEQIAARQTELHPADWTAWCVRLGQTLELVAAEGEVEAFRGLGLDPFSALRAEPFRPDFAKDGSSPEGRLYEEALERVATAWQVSGLEPFEA